MSFRLAKGPNYPLFRKFKFFNMATPENYGGSYLKNLCYERPELAYGMTQVKIDIRFVNKIGITANHIFSSSSSLLELPILWKETK